MTISFGGETGFPPGPTSILGPGLLGFSPGFCGLLMVDAILPAQHLAARHGTYFD
jgi:hypothetical protein